MKFQRFGNAFVAQADNGTLYVVSFYMSSWTVHYRSSGMTFPQCIEKYGYGSPQEACQAAEKFATADH